jgi:hypothetical protein
VAATAEADDEAADRGERLGEAADDEVGLVLDAEVVRRAAAAGTDDADAVGVVDHDARLVALRDLDQLRQWREVAAHAVDAVDSDETGLLLNGLGERLVERRHVVVQEADHLAVRQLAAVVDRGVVGLVHEDGRVARGERGDGTEVGLVARREGETGLLAEEAGEELLEALVELGRAVEQARAGHRGAVLLDGVAGGLDDARMARQAEVVVGAEHEDALAVDDGLGALVALQRLEEGVVVEGLGHLDQRESSGLVENVAAVGIVVQIRRERIDGDRFREGFVYQGSGLGGQVNSPFPVPAGPSSKSRDPAIP